MSRNYRQRPQRKRFFLGCEGKSEHAYGQLLNKLAQQLGIPVYLDVRTLTPGAGDPIALVKRAAKTIKQTEKKRTAYLQNFVLLDHDRAPAGSQIAEDTDVLARGNNITLIWQRPCHEAFLLRHLQGHSDKKPLNSSESEKALIKAWPEYDKPMTRNQLGQRIGINEVRQAMGIEPELQTFLRAIGLN